MRPADTVSRLDRDELALLLPDVGDPAAVVERLQQTLAVPFVIGETSLALTASMGLAMSTIGFDRPEEALCHADAAMHRAKARGRTIIGKRPTFSDLGPRRFSGPRGARSVL